MKLPLRSQFRKEPIKFWDGVQVVIVFGCAVLLAVGPFALGVYIVVHFIIKYW